MKTCSKCGIEKPITCFYKKLNKTTSRCIECTKTDQKIDRSINPEKHSSYNKNNRNKNKRKIKEYQKRYSENNSENNKEYQKRYRNENKEILAEKDRIRKFKKYQNNEKYRLSKIIRHRFRGAMKIYSKNGKTQSCKEYGIDFEAIFNHVGPRPEGKYHLDHKIPLCKFDLDNPEHVRLAHLPQNLQWLTEDDNLKKNDSIDMELIRCSLSLTIIAKKIGIL